MAMDNVKPSGVAKVTGFLKQGKGKTGKTADNNEDNSNKDGKTAKASKAGKIPVLVYLPENLNDRLNEYSDVSGMSKSGIVCMALYEYFKSNGMV